MSAAAPARVKARDAREKEKPPAVRKRTSGYLAIDFGIEFYEIPRLCSGKAEICIVQYILSETKSADQIEVREKGKTTLRKRRPNEPAPRFTRWIKVEEFSEYARCKPRAVEDALKRLCEAGVIEKDAKGPGYRCLVEKWSKLPDYTPEPIKLAVVDDPEDEDLEEEEQQIAAESVPVFKAPLELLPNRAGRARELPKPAVKLQLRSDVRAQVDAVINQGLLLIRIHGLASEQEKQGEHKAKKHVTAWPAKNGSGGSNGLNRNVQELAGADGFAQYMEACTRCKMRASEEDWKTAASLWKGLSIEHRIAAVQGLNDHFAAGDIEFLGRPDTFLQKKAWQRGVRKRIDPKDQGREEAMDWARSISRNG